MTRAAQVAQRSGGAEHTRDARMSAEDATMKAYLVNRYQSPMQAGGAAEPTVGDRDVLVDIHAAGVNQLDAKMRDGEFKFLLAYKAPFTLRHDQAGVVTRVGSAVTRFTVGDQGLRATARPPHRHLRRAHRRKRGRSRDQARETLHGRGGLGAPRIRPGVYRLGTLAGRRTLSAVARMAAQGLPAAMLDPFSPGSARKWSSEPLLKQENRATARFPRALCRTRTGDPFLTIEAVHAAEMAPLQGLPRELVWQN